MKMTMDWFLTLCSTVELQRVSFETQLVDVCVCVFLKIREDAENFS